VASFSTASQNRNRPIWTLWANGRVSQTFFERFKGKINRLTVRIAGPAVIVVLVRAGPPVISGYLFPILPSHPTSICYSQLLYLSLLCEKPGLRFRPVRSESGLMGRRARSGLGSMCLPHHHLGGRRPVQGKQRRRGRPIRDDAGSSPLELPFCRPCKVCVNLKSLLK
jgi:hypothetical protein